MTPSVVEWPRLERIGERAAVIEHQGPRPTMEDAHFVITGFAGSPQRTLAGVFDGHGGPTVSRCAAERLPSLVEAGIHRGEPAQVVLRAALLEADAQCGKPHEGSTAVVAILEAESVTVANLGDAGALLVRRDSEQVLTADHRITNLLELARVKAAGAYIDGVYVCKPGTEWGVMPTRGLGDHALREVGIIAEADTSRTAVGKDATWLILGCDGLWDFLEPARVAALARASPGPALLCERLAKEVLEVRNGTDNLTVVAISLPLQTGTP